MNKKGFTLIELLATIVIIAFIMGIVLPSASRVSNENRDKMCTAYEDMMEEYAQTSLYKDQYFIELDDLDELQKVKNDCDGYVTIDYSVSPPKYNAHILCNNGCQTPDYIEDVEYEKIKIDVPGCKANVIYNGQAQNLINEGEGYTLSNEKRINIGKQNVVVNIADKRAFAWKPDGSQAEKVIRNCEMKKRPITLKANDITFTYLDTPPAFDYTLSNTITGENPLASAVTYQVKDSNGNKVTITSNSPAGVYTIIPSSTVTNNYSLVIQNGTLTINRKPVPFPTCNNKIYDGKENTLFVAHSLEYSNTAIKGKDAGTYTGTLTPTSNYVWNSGDNITEGRTLSCIVNQKELSINTPSCSNKIYDGNKNVNCTITYDGIVSGDSVTPGATCSFSNKIVGNNKTVTCKNFTKSGSASNNYSLVSQNKTTTANITAKSITASVASCDDRVYNGGTTASCAIGLSDYVPGDSISAGSTCKFDNKNIGSKKTVTCTTFIREGTDKDNYTISTTSATGKATITAKALTANTPSSCGKTYNRSTNAPCTVSASGIVSGDKVNVSATCTYADKKVGNSKTVTCSSFTISGDDSGNYTAPSGSKTTTANITAKALTANTPSCSNKTFDGNNSANCTITYSGIESGDTVTTGASCTFNDANVGTGKTVTCSSFTKAGADHSNYTAPTGNKTTTASVTAKALTITANAQTIDYGSSIATGTGYVTVNGLVSGDSLTGVTLTPSTTSVTTSGTITPSKATTSKGISNYSVTYNAGNLTINSTISDGYVILSGVSDFVDKSVNPAVDVTTYNINHHGGTLSCSSSNTTVATCSISGSVLRIVRNKVKGNTVITVSSTATSSYTAASTTYSHDQSLVTCYCQKNDSSGVSDRHMMAPCGLRGKVCGSQSACDNACKSYCSSNYSWPSSNSSYCGTYANGSSVRGYDGRFCNQ